MKKEKSLLILYGLFLWTVFFGSGCYTYRNQILFQGMKDTSYTASMVQKRPIIQRGDQLSIFVYGLDERSTAYFNTPMGVGNGNGGMQMLAGGQGSNLIGYFVNEEGSIEFPRLGTLNILGYTQEQLRDSLQIWLQPWVKDPVVNVRLINFRVTFITTDRAQTIVVPNNKTNIVQFLGMVGGIGWSDKKNNVKVIRQIDDKQQVFVVDLRKHDVFTSPIYYLQPNDIVYVEPNRRKYLESNAQLISLVTSITSTVTVFILFINTLK